jgi:hypothetical protein
MRAVVVLGRPLPWGPASQAVASTAGKLEVEGRLPARPFTSIFAREMLPISSGKTWQARFARVPFVVIEG